MDHYLSLISSNRTVDLCFDTIESRDDFKALLDGLVRKEHGQLTQSIDLERPTTNFTVSITSFFIFNVASIMPWNDIHFSTSDMAIYRGVTKK